MTIPARRSRFLAHPAGARGDGQRESRVRHLRRRPAAAPRTSSASQLGVSRTTVRRALQSMEQIGLIERRPGRGDPPPHPRPSRPAGRCHGLVPFPDPAWREPRPRCRLQRSPWAAARQRGRRSWRCIPGGDDGKSESLRAERGADGRRRCRRCRWSKRFPTAVLGSTPPPTRTCRPASILFLSERCFGQPDRPHAPGDARAAGDRRQVRARNGDFRPRARARETGSPYLELQEVFYLLPARRNPSPSAGSRSTRPTSPFSVFRRFLVARVSGESGAAMGASIHRLRGGRGRGFGGTMTPARWRRYSAAGVLIGAGGEGCGRRPRPRTRRAPGRAASPSSADVSIAVGRSATPSRGDASRQWWRPASRVRTVAGAGHREVAVGGRENLEEGGGRCRAPAAAGAARSSNLVGLQRRSCSGCGRSQAAAISADARPGPWATIVAPSASITAGSSAARVGVGDGAADWCHGLRIARWGDQRRRFGGERGRGRRPAGLVSSSRGCGSFAAPIAIGRRRAASRMPARPAPRVLRSTRQAPAGRKRSASQRHQALAAGRITLGSSSAGATPGKQRDSPPRRARAGEGVTRTSAAFPTPFPLAAAARGPR